MLRDNEDQHYAAGTESFHEEQEYFKERSQWQRRVKTVTDEYDKVWGSESFNITDILT